jgi:acyl dehydratase
LSFCRRDDTTALAALIPIAAAAAARLLRTALRRIAFVAPVAIGSTIRSHRFFLCNSRMIVSTPG